MTEFSLFCDIASLTILEHPGQLWTGFFPPVESLSFSVCDYEQ